MTTLAEQKIRKQLGGKIKELRTSKKETQESLAASINSSKDYVSHVESGIKSPSLGFLVKIANKLKIDLQEFFKF